MVNILQNSDLNIGSLKRALSSATCSLLNPVCPVNLSHLSEIVQQFNAHIWIPTSGTNCSRFVALSHQALLSSAAAVNKWFDISAADCWALPLPLRHIGGLSVVARSMLTDFRIAQFEVKWNAKAFHAFLIDQKCTLASLVPTQLYDLVIGQGLACPPAMRAVITGGGRLDRLLYERARALSWPLIPTYGMTEFASQIASARLESLSTSHSAAALVCLPHVECQISQSGRLQIKGPSMLSAWIAIDRHQGVNLNPVNQECFFETDDLAELHPGREIRILGRVGRLIKHKGVLISLDQIEEALIGFFNDRNLTPKIALSSCNHLRDGQSVVLHYAGCTGLAEIRGQINDFLRTAVCGLPAIHDFIEHESLPVLESGKIDLRELDKWQ